MNTRLLLELGRSAQFIKLLKLRRRAKIMMLSLMMVVFVTSQILWAFFPEIVNQRIPEGSNVSLAVWLTVLVVLSAIGLSGYYSLVTGKQLDKLNDERVRNFRETHHD